MLADEGYVGRFLNEQYLVGTPTGPIEQQALIRVVTTDAAPVDGYADESRAFFAAVFGFHNSFGMVRFETELAGHAGWLLRCRYGNLGLGVYPMTRAERVAKFARKVPYFEIAHGVTESGSFHSGWF